MDATENSPGRAPLEEPPSKAAKRETPWVILLAGGEGTRLRGRTVGNVRFDRPKQFCRLHGDRTLLETAIERASGITDRARILPVVLDSHRAWWQPLLGALPQDHVISQPGNLGNAVAIFHALFQVLRRERNPVVVILPSDHGSDDELSLRRALLDTVVAARERSDRVVLLGLEPDHAETDYGWIVPLEGRDGRSRGVLEFHEKPGPAEAEALMRRGGLWNAFMFAGTALALLRLFDDARPDLLGVYPESLLSRELDPRAVTHFFGRVPALDFGRDVLTRSPYRLRVVAAPSSGWIDLGTPARVAEWLSRATPGRYALTSSRPWPLPVAAANSSGRRPDLSSPVPR